MKMFNLIRDGPVHFDATRVNSPRFHHELDHFLL